MRLADRDGVHLRLPFDRYYVEADLAPHVQEACRRHDAAQTSNAHITVRVRGGFAVLEDLYVDGKPVAEFLDASR